MPRNDQSIRQWHLLRRLEGSNGLSLHELVDSVPDGFPKNARTVRRDLEALEAVGFPRADHLDRAQSGDRTTSTSKLMLHDYGFYGRVL